MSKEETILYLDFKNNNGKNTSIRVYDPEENLTKDQVKTAMTTIMNSNVFYPKLVALDGARIVTRTVEEIETI